MAMKKSKGARKIFFAGAAATLALPPFFIWPLWFAGISYLYFSVRNCSSAKQAFWAGWWWGFGYFVAGLYWIVNSLLVDAASFGWMIPFALTLLPGALAIYIAIACAAARRIGVDDWRLAGIFAVCFTVAEWLRGHMFTGFPWNLPAYVLNAHTETLQLAAVIGAYGCTFVVVAIGIMPAIAFIMRRKMPAIIAIVVVASIYGFGAWRLADNPTQYIADAKIRIVQGNIPQKLKWQQGQREGGVFKHIGLSRREPDDGIKAVIWSETAVPFLLEPDSELTELLAEAVPENGVLITGADRSENNNWYNSLFVLGSGGRVEGYYDKKHLVPFGEYVPLRKFIPIISLVYGGGDFKAGEGAAVLNIPGLPPALPLICYEAIFPEAVVDSKQAGWLLNITNDAWFGDSTGPRQHLEMARMRAVETGLPLVRVANTGISALVDGYGRVLQRIEINSENMVDVVLPQAVTLPAVW